MRFERSSIPVFFCSKELRISPRRVHTHRYIFWRDFRCLFQKWLNLSRSRRSRTTEECELVLGPRPIALASAFELARALVAAGRYQDGARGHSEFDFEIQVFVVVSMCSPTAPWKEHDTPFQVTTLRRCAKIRQETLGRAHPITRSTRSALVSTPLRRARICKKIQVRETPAS